MNPRNDRKRSAQPAPAASPAPRRRFRMEKLEERIAPKKQGGGGDGGGSSGKSSGLSGSGGTIF